LFDQDGRLVGITTFLMEQSQNLNFALPASWVLELPSRQADLIEHNRRERTEQRAGAAPADLRRKEEELAAAQAALIGERRSLYAEPAAKKPDPIQDFYKDAGKVQDKDAGPQPVTLSQTLGAPPLPAAPKSSSIDENAVLKRYARDISRIIGKSTSESDYPKLARENGWEGTPEVRLVIGADGHVKNVLIATGSDYAILDERAVEIVRQVQLPKIPSVLRAREFSITVPIAFTLQKP
jgi:TonB family protein